MADAYTEPSKQLHVRAASAAAVDERASSYSSSPMPLLSRVKELANLAAFALAPVGASVDCTLETIQSTERRVFERTGLRIQDLDMLEIGPGQFPRRLLAWSLKNRVVGIDTDVIPRGFRLDEYWRLLRHSPTTRIVKTLGRKLTLRDARADAVLAGRLGVRRFSRADIRLMSATDMSFPDNSFSFACSYSVFEHIDDPQTALSEIKRVLRPGGVAYISIHLYTSHSGQHDAGIFRQGGHPQHPFWPHLRPAYQHTVQESTYLNRLRLADWHRLFDAEMPGADFLGEFDDPVAGEALKDLRAHGELADFTDEELLTVNLIAVWEKPL
jgi:SAM-dependent methyltransferase